MELSNNNVPKHIGIILDGNRRFAKRLMMKPWKGHEWGAEKVRALMDWCLELGVNELTVYAFSLENFNRPKEEFDYLINIFKKEFNLLMSEENQKKIIKNDIRINFLGRISMLPVELQESIKKVVDFTKENKKNIVNFAMAYSGRAEIIDATKKISELVKEGKMNIDEINEDTFSKQLYRNSDPDLIIRTSGEKRTSGFMIWQGSYSELYFCDKYWPEFEKEDLIEIIEDYKQRERRFGK